MQGRTYPVSYTHLDVYKRQVQTMRKEAGFEVMDKIAVTYEGTEKAEKVFADNASTICLLYTSRWV